MLLLLQHECMNQVTACYCLSPPRGLLNDPNIDYLIRLSYRRPPGLGRSEAILLDNHQRQYRPSALALPLSTQSLIQLCILDHEADPSSRPRLSL